jgi:exonuclease VII small subunit
LFGTLKSLEDFVGDKFGGTGSADITKRIKTLDSALADLVKSGNTKQAAADWQYLQSKTDGSKEALQHLTDLFPQYTRAAQKSKPATDDQTSASQATATAFEDAANKVQDLQNQLNNLIDTLNKSNDANQTAITANAAYQDALASVNDTIQKAKSGQDGYSTSLDQNTKAGADNVAMFADLANKSQAAAAAQFQVDGNTQNYVATLQSGKQALIDTITNLTGNAAAAQDLADKVYQIPSQHEIDIQSTAIEIKNNVDNLNNALKALPHDTYVDIWQTTHILSQVDASREQEQHRAGGGYISGPGTGVSDSIPAYLSNGEYVVRAAATARNRALLDYINRGGVARFAQGGFVDARHVQRFANGGPVAGAVGSSVTNVNTFNVPAIETQDPTVYATIIGREFARRSAG